MSLSQSVKLSLASVTQANFRHSAFSLFLLFVYIGMGVGIFSGFAYFLLDNEQAIKQGVFDYFFPDSWHFFVEKMIDFFFDSQSKLVLAGALSGGAVVLMSMLLFPLKEWCSAAYERAIGLPNGQPRELPLMTQFKEESKLLLLYVTAQFIILALGYYPFKLTQILSISFSALFLCFTFGIDFIAPTLQRHGIRYSQIIKFLLGKPVMTLLFGAVFALPVLLVGRIILSVETLSFLDAAIYIFLVSLLFLSLAIASGTFLASKILNQVKETKVLGKRTRKTGYGFIWVLFGIGLTFHSAIALSLHHKSQLLKCHYDVAWSQVGFSSSSLLGMLKDRGKMNLTLPVEIHNPTEFDVYIETSQLIITQNEKLVSEIDISQLDVPAGATTVKKVELAADIQGKSLSNFTGLLDGWQIYLTYDVLPGIPLIVKVK